MIWRASGQEAPERDPMTQKTMAGSCPRGSAVIFTIIKNAWNIDPVITPVSTRTSTREVCTARAMASAIPTAQSPMTNERRRTIKKDDPGIRSPTEAPKVQPAATPRISGDTRGLRKRP